MKNFYKINTLLIIFLSLSANAFFTSEKPSFDGKYKVNVSETMSINKDILGVETEKEFFFSMVKNSLKTDIIFEGNVVKIIKNAELIDACIFNKEKYEIACKEETYLITPENDKREILHLLSESMPYFISIKKQ